MSRVIAHYCECRGRGHEPGCPLEVRLRIKAQVCEEFGVVNYIPDDVADEIDRRVAAALLDRQNETPS